MNYSLKARRIRRSLAVYDKHSLLVIIFRHLNYSSGEVSEEAGRYPWLCCLLIEWTFQVSSYDKTKNASYNDFNDLLKKMIDLQSDAVDFRDNQNIDLSMRKMIVSQLAYQIPLAAHLQSLIRSYVLLVGGKYRQYHEEKFLGAVGISLKVYMELSIWLLGRVVVSRGNISFKSILMELNPSYSIEEIALFLRSVGGSPIYFHDLLQKHKDYSVSVDAYFDEPRFKSKPLIFNGDNILLIGKQIAMSTIANKMIDILREHGGERFLDRFTKGFEDHVGNLISKSPMKFLSETDIESYYKENNVEGKKVDFVILEDDAAVFVDAKGISPHVKVKVDDAPQVIYSRLKKSFLKGVKQASECSLRLKSMLGDKSASANSFCLIITFQDFFILNGRMIKEEVAPDFSARLRRRSGITYPMKMFILSL